MKGYCRHCKKHVQIKDAVRSVLEDSRISYRGICPLCSKDLVKISSPKKGHRKKTSSSGENNFMEKIARVLIKKKAEDVVLLDLRGVNPSLCEFFLLCTARTDNHARILEDKVVEYAESKKIRVYHREKDQDNRWTLVDFGNLILHIFQEETRKFYELERLWSQARKITYS